MMQRVASVTLGLVAILLVGARLLGARRWRAGTRGLRARLDVAREPVRTRTFDYGELEGLPAPVGRYFRKVLEEGQPMVDVAHVRHTGTFDMGETTDWWRPFTSDQRVVARRPGFDLLSKLEAVTSGLIPGSHSEGRRSRWKEARTNRA